MFVTKMYTSPKNQSDGRNVVDKYRVAKRATERSKWRIPSGKMDSHAAGEPCETYVGRFVKINHCHSFLTGVCKRRTRDTIDFVFYYIEYLVEMFSDFYPCTITGGKWVVDFINPSVLGKASSRFALTFFKEFPSSQKPVHPKSVRISVAREHPATRGQYEVCWCQWNFGELPTFWNLKNNAMAVKMKL